MSLKTENSKTEIIEETKENKSKMQFSKNMCLRSWWLMTISVFICMGGEFILQYTSRGSMSEVVTIVLALVSFVTVFVNGGYICQNIFRDTSLNKNGIYLDEKTGYKQYMEPTANNNRDL